MDRDPVDNVVERALDLDQVDRTLRRHLPVDVPTILLPPAVAVLDRFDGSEELSPKA